MHSIRVERIMAPTSALAAAAWSLIMALSTGCSDRPYHLAPVSGLVTLDGQVVPYTQVVFQPKGSPDRPAPGPGSTAYCDEAGRFELKTVRGEPGAVVGVHSVQIYAHGPPQPTTGDTNVGPPGKEAFPAQFNVETQLAFEVPAEGTTTANFKLSSR
jgi:hypothetical protein